MDPGPTLETCFFGLFAVWNMTWVALPLKILVHASSDHFLYRTHYTTLTTSMWSTVLTVLNVQENALAIA